MEIHILVKRLEDLAGWGAGGGVEREESGGKWEESGRNEIREESRRRMQKEHHKLHQKAYHMTISMFQGSDEQNLIKV